jgi:hypothetical protein
MEAQNGHVIMCALVMCGELGKLPKNTDPNPHLRIVAEECECA